MLNFLNEWWPILLAVLAVIGIIIFLWFREKAKLKEYLIYAVSMAEKELGSNTGELKLRYVYELFITKFPKFSLFISFNTFKKLVDGALDSFEVILEQIEIKETSKQEELTNDG